MVHFIIGIISQLKSNKGTSQWVFVPRLSGMLGVCRLTSSWFLIENALGDLFIRDCFKATGHLTSLSSCTHIIISLYALLSRRSALLPLFLRNSPPPSACPAQDSCIGVQTMLLTSYEAPCKVSYLPQFPSLQSGAKNNALSMLLQVTGFLLFCIF